MDKILVILGPTATGKTDIALQLASKLQGELISCDSRQVYKGLDIGTGKMPGKNSNFQFSIFKKNGFWTIDGIKIWMYDVENPKNQYTVKDYIDQASKVIADIIARGKLPIIVGGTGFYLKALLEGLPNLEIPVDSKLRKKLKNLSLQELQGKLQKISPRRWENMNNSDQNNPRRLIRAIEILSIKTSPRSNFVTPRRWNRWNKILKIGLTAPRETLQSRIGARLITRINQGMIEEAKNLHQNGLSLTRMKELGLEYGILAKLLEGAISKNQLVAELSAKIYQYAKRQITWFKTQKDIFWFDITDKNWEQKMEKIISKWYDEGNDNT